MDTVNTPVPILRETLAAPVTLAMNWTAMDLTVLVTYFVKCITMYLSILLSFL